MPDNLGSIIARRAVDGTVTVFVYAGAALAAVLLPVLGPGPSPARAAGRAGGGALVGLVVLLALIAAAHWAESELITRELPRLLRGGRL